MFIIDPIIEEILERTDVIVALVAAASMLIFLPPVLSFISRMKRMDNREVLGNIIKHTRWPVTLFISILLLHISTLEQVLGRHETVNDIALVLLIASFTWFLLRIMKVVKIMVHARYSVDHPDNLDERKVRTQYQYIHALISIIILLIGLSFALFQFDRLRMFGAGMLASAGLTAVILAFTAQQTLSNLIAGFQIAFTQPFRIDDVVIVEGEWGRIEEITLTYVVVRIWDQRRLVLPISYFITNPFQNWTRTTSEIISTVTIHVDYSVPVKEVMGELNRIVEESDLWDGKVAGLQVTDASDRTITLRRLMNASNASAAWDLRCHVREELIEFLQRNYSGSLPRIRLEEMGRGRAIPECDRGG